MDEREPRKQTISPADAHPFAPDPPESPWRTLSARETYRNPWIRVTEYAVVRPDGQRGIYGVVDPGPNVSIVALDERQHVWLAGEFVYPVGAFLWNLPTGKVEDGEDPLEAARRELAEEAGLTATQWTLLGSYYLSPGISTQETHLYLARDVRAGAAQPEGTERITLRTLPLREAYAASLRGEIRGAPSALGLWRAWVYLHGES